MLYLIESSQQLHEEGSVITPILQIGMNGAGFEPSTTRNKNESSSSTQLFLRIQNCIRPFQRVVSLNLLSHFPQPGIKGSPWAPPGNHPFHKHSLHGLPRSQLGTLKLPTARAKLPTPASLLNSLPTTHRRPVCLGPLGPIPSCVQLIIPLSPAPSTPHLNQNFPGDI